MQQLKDQLLSILRNVNTNMDTFRKVTDKLTTILAHETALLLERAYEPIKTPNKEMMGVKFTEQVVLIPILRSGMAMLPSFTHFFNNCKVGVVGYRRDETTARAISYYKNLPVFEENDRIVIIDPMLATGGTASSTIELLLKENVPEEKIIFTGIIASPEGKRHLELHYPKVNIVLGAVDEYLNDVKYIVPGIGDFGDRYFGTVAR